MRPTAALLALLMVAPLVVATSPPSEPLLPAATTGTGIGEIDLSWSAPASPGSSPIGGYHLYRSLTPNGIAHLALVGNVLSFTDATVPDARPYFYRVAAVNADGEGPLSEAVSAQANSVPTVPTGFRALTGPGTTNVTLQWGAPIHDGLSPVLDYRVYRAPSWSGPFTLEATVAASTTSYVDAIGSTNTTFAYRVSALNANGEGPMTGVLNGTTAHKASAPMNVTAAQKFPISGILVTWEPPIDKGGLRFEAWFVKRSVDGAPFANLFRITPGIMNADDETCPIQSTCSYIVAAVNELGLGAFSDPTTPVMGDAIPVRNRCLPCGSS